MNGHPHIVRPTLLAALVYAAAAGVFTWPLVLHPFALFGATDPAGDPSLNLWTLGWDLQTLFAHPGWWLTGRVFDANIYFPAPHTLAYADHLLLQALAVSPVYAITRDLVFTYNVLLLGSLVASALAMHLLARALTSSEPAAFVAGLIYGFAPFHFTHLTHIQLQALYFLPLSFLFLHRLFAGARRADTVGLGIVLGLQAVSSAYYGIIGGIGLAVAAASLVVLTGRIRDWRLLRRLLTAAAIALFVMLPWSVPYLLIQREAGGGRNLDEVARGSAVLASYLQAPPTNLLYGRTGWLRPGPTARLPRKDGPEQALFPGFCALLLAIAGALVAPRGLKRIAAAYAILALAGLVLSLGPEGARAVYGALYNGLFGMAAIRASARFSVLTLCAIAVLAAMAVPALALRRGRVRPLAVAAMVVIAIEYSNGRIAFPAAPVLTSEAGLWLRDQPAPGAVICVPMRVFDGNTPCMLQSLEHRRAVVNGYSGVRPLFFEALVDVMSRLPSPESLLAMHDLGVEFVVSDGALPVGSGLGGALVERARFADQYVYQVAWSPEIEATLRASTDVRPPEPGTPPFTVGETATYRVRWTNGPIGVPAAEATIAVAPPQGSESFRFAVSATTAPWVSRFYQVDARLEATTNGRLLPLEYREAIDEGKRRIDRRAQFDFTTREVRIDSGGASIVLPLGAEARDPISALFYIRTLPIEKGARYSLPISDNGRRLTLDVVVHDLESIELDGRPWSVWKLEPRLSQRIDRESPEIAAWVSADARRIPVLVEVSAGFGSVRLELASYRER